VFISNFVNQLVDHLVGGEKVLYLFQIANKNDYPDSFLIMEGDEQVFAGKTMAVSVLKNLNLPV
jgi:hypothetical protein